MKVLVTGASGFVGRHLVKELLNKGHQVVVATRNAPKASLVLGQNCEYLSWTNNAELPELGKFPKLDGVIHLMGANIAEGFWTDERKKVLFKSRVQASQSLMQAIQKYNDNGGNIQSIVSTSAVGIYGTDLKKEFDEESEVRPDDFLSRLCASWEDSVLNSKQGPERRVVIRTGVVLGKDGGMLNKILPIFKMNLGGVLGHGEQTLSWIHINDLVNIYVQCFENSEMKGIYNGVAPRPVSNRIFTFALSKILKKFAFFKVPGFILETVLGAMSTIMLEGQKVFPKRLMGAGFNFKFDHIESALNDLLKK